MRCAQDRLPVGDFAKIEPAQQFLSARLGGLKAAVQDEVKEWLATLKDWPVIVVWVDIAWGVFLTSSVATASFFIGRWLMS